MKSITKKCSVKECNRPSWARKYCTKHYQQMKSNGQLKNKLVRHGNTQIPEYWVWCDMTRRCNNSKYKSYYRYGGRGIKVCKKWTNNFPQFLIDMGKRPTPRHQIERIDNNGNYEPSNCKWATPKQQANNRNTNTYITIEKRTQTIAQWCDEYGLFINTFINRIQRGWTGIDLLRKPDQGHSLDTRKLME